MQSDVELLRTIYSELHPGLLRYNNASEINARFTDLSAAVASPRTLRTFYLELSRLLATIRCGHTYANFYNQKKSVRESLFEAPDRFPFEFLWLGSRMTVSRDPYGTGVKPGSEILSIESHASADILQKLLPFTRADGHNDAKRRRLLSVQGEDRFETFDVFFSMLFGRERYRVQVEDPDGRRRNSFVPAVTPDQRRAASTWLTADDSAPAWTIERHAHTAVLSMPTWALYESSWDWKTWLNEALDDLVRNQVPRLIIDLRGNEGGQDCGNVIISRLIKKPTMASQVRRLVRYQKVRKDLLPYLDTWDHSWDDWKGAAQPYNKRFFQLAGEDWGTEIIEPRGPRFLGAVDVLIGPQNSSATFQFAQLVRRERLGRLAGEATGGNRRGINGGCFYFVRLPGTGLEADLPLIGQFPTVLPPDAGLAPDLFIPVARKQLASGRDLQLEKLLLS